MCPFLNVPSPLTSTIRTLRSFKWACSQSVETIASAAGGAARPAARASDKSMGNLHPCRRPTGQESCTAGKGGKGGKGWIGRIDLPALLPVPPLLPCSPLLDKEHLPVRRQRPRLVGHGQLDGIAGLAQGDHRGDHDVTEVLRVLHGIRALVLERVRQLVGALLQL